MLNLNPHNFNEIKYLRMFNLKQPTYEKRGREKSLYAGVVDSNKEGKKRQKASEIVYADLQGFDKRSSLCCVMSFVDDDTKVVGDF